MPGFRPPAPGDGAARGEGPPGHGAPRAQAVRCFLFGLASDKGPRLLAFQMGNILIGRLPDNHLSINHVSVSRRHARIAVGTAGVVIEDMGSQNGTSVNGTPIRGENPLRPGDIIRLGHVPLFYFGFIDPDRPPQPERVDHSLAVIPALSSTG